MEKENEKRIYLTQNYSTQLSVVQEKELAPSGRTIESENWLLPVHRLGLNWQALHNHIGKEVKRLVADYKQSGIPYNVYPLAPISACISFGYNLSRQTKDPYSMIQLFQWDREGLSWDWPELPLDESIIDTLYIDIFDPAKCKPHIALCLNLSATVSREELIAALPGQDATQLNISVKTPSVYWLKYASQLAGFKSLTDGMLRSFTTTRTIDVFYAGPAPGAVTLGMQLGNLLKQDICLYEYVPNRAPGKSHYLPSLMLHKPDFICKRD